MFKSVDIKNKLTQLRRKTRRAEDDLISETKRILKKDLFEEKKILENLKQYNRSFEILDEEDLEEELIFTVSEIKQIAVIYRLKFLESRIFKPEIPYEAILRIKDLNLRFRKEVRIFKVLAPRESFFDKRSRGEALLFGKTNYDNYYLIHRWGNKLKWHRKLMFWPIRNFETLFFTVILFTLIITLSLPTWIITLDPRAEYWSGFRMAAFFHLLIFNMGVTAFITFAFTKNFSSSIWNQEKDFD
jgi:hypothetical protein